MKKILAILLAAMLAFGATAMADELVTIVGSGIGGDIAGPVGGWVGDLWAEKGYQLEALATNNNTEQIQIWLASGDLPEIIRFGNWKDYETAVEAGYLVALDDYLDQMPNTMKYAEAAVNYIRDYHSVGTGKVWGIPDNVGDNTFGTDAGCYAFNIRWDIYAQAGYPKAEKLEDMIDVFKAMKEVYPKNEEGLETYAINMFAEWDGGSRFSFANAVLCTLGYYEGGQTYFVDYHIPTDTVTSIFEDDSAFKRACKFLYSLNQAGLVDPDALTQQYTTSQSKIGNGQYLACWWGGYQSAFDTLEKKNQDPPVGFAPVIFDEYVASTMGNYPVGTSWPLCISKNADPEKIEALVRFIDLNADPEFLYELYNGPKGLFWDIDADGKTFATEAGYEYAEKGAYTLESGEEYKYFNGRYTLKGNFMTDEGIIDSTYEDEMFALGNNNNLLKAWSEFYGGEYAFPIDKIIAEDRLALRPMSLVTFLPSLDEDTQMIRDAIGAVIQQKGWQMVYAADEAEFEALWDAMVSDCEALGAEIVQEWFKENLAQAKEKAAAFGEN